MNDFFIDANFINDMKIVKMMTDYGFVGLGYYFAVLAELYKNGGRLGLEDLGIIAKNINIDKKKMRNFISNCIEKYKVNNESLFSTDGTFFWSNQLINDLKRRKKYSLDGKKGGRKKCEIPKPIVNITDIEFVRLTEDDIEKLKAKYGESLINSAIHILDNWLATSTPTAKKAKQANDHYGYFRKDSWVLEAARTKLSKKDKSNWSYC